MAWITPVSTSPWPLAPLNTKDLVKGSCDKRIKIAVIGCATLAATILAVCKYKKWAHARKIEENIAKLPRLTMPIDEENLLDNSLTPHTPTQPSTQQPTPPPMAKLEKNHHCKKISDKIECIQNNLTHNFTLDSLYVSDDFHFDENRKPIFAQPNNWLYIYDAILSIQRICLNHAQDLSDMCHNPILVELINEQIKKLMQDIKALLSPLNQSSKISTIKTTTNLTNDQIIQAYNRIIGQYEQLYASLSEANILSTNTIATIESEIQQFKDLVKQLDQSLERNSKKIRR